MNNECLRKAACEARNIRHQKKYLYIIVTRFFLFSMNLETQIVSLLSQLPWLAMGISVVAAFLIGSFWYGPIFGRTWMKLVNIKNPDPSKMGRSIGIELVFVLIRVLALGIFFTAIAPTSFLGHQLLACLLFWGAGAAIIGSKVAWEGISWKLFFIDAGRLFIDLHVMALIFYFV